jgi:hypothetical protein
MRICKRQRVSAQAVPFGSAIQDELVILAVRY